MWDGPRSRKKNLWGQLQHGQTTLRGGSRDTGNEVDLDVNHRFQARQNRRRIDFRFRHVLERDGKSGLIPIFSTFH